jgi:FAD/FMN-containing dehydrogenase
MSLTSDFLADLGDIPVITSGPNLRSKSRDFFWYSPFLKRALDHVTADGVATPRTKAEVLQVLAACHRHDVPLTTRGGGTGNYGQAMPLAGGLVLDMTGMNRILQIGRGTVATEPGILIGVLDDALRATGQELRMHPSTRETATIGGFIAGGSGGVGSVRWGALREAGNILSLEVATLEATPRLIRVEGAELALVHHAYGTNGVITEVSLPATPATNWVDLLLAFPDWRSCLEAGARIAGTEGLWLKELGAIEAPAPHDYFLRHRKFLGKQDHVLVVIAAENGVAPLLGLAQRLQARVAFRSDTSSAEEREGLPHAHHLVWNHTTLRALKTDPAMTYDQLGLPEDRPLDTLLAIAGRFPGEVIGHVEFVRSDGRVRFGFLPIIRYTDDARFAALLRDLRAIGCDSYSPHAYTLEEGNHRQALPEELAMKRRMDPKGLMNPGKLIAWQDPDWRLDPDTRYAWPGLKGGAQ